MITTIFRSKSFKRPLLQQQSQRQYSKQILQRTSRINSSQSVAAVGGLIPLYVQQQCQPGSFLPPPPLPLALSVFVESPAAKRHMILYARVKEAVQTLWNKVKALWRLGQILLVSSPCLLTYPLVKALRTRYPSLYESWWQRYVRLDYLLFFLAIILVTSFLLHPPQQSYCYSQLPWTLCHQICSMG